MITRPQSYLLYTLFILIILKLNIIIMSMSITTNYVELLVSHDFSYRRHADMMHEYIGCTMQSTGITH